MARKRKRIGAFCALLATIAALMAFNYYLFTLQADKKQHIDGLQMQVGIQVDENKKLDDRNRVLQRSVDMLRSPDSFYAYEEKARENYGMIGNDETFFILPKEELANIDDIAELEENQEDKKLENKAHPSTASVTSDERPITTANPIAVSPAPVLRLESLE